MGTTTIVERGENTITKIRITPEGLHIGSSFYLIGNQLMQRFVLTEPYYTRSIFRLTLFQSRLVQRIDMRYLNHSWITVLIHGNRVNAVALYGANLVDSLQQMGEAAVERGVLAQRQNVQASHDFGLSSGHVVGRSGSSTSIRSATPQSNVGQRKDETK